MINYTANFKGRGPDKGPRKKRKATLAGHVKKGAIGTAAVGGLLNAAGGAVSGGLLGGPAGALAGGLYGGLTGAASGGLYGAGGGAAVYGAKKLLANRKKKKKSRKANYSVHLGTVSNFIN